MKSIKVLLLVFIGISGILLTGCETVSVMCANYDSYCSNGYYQVYDPDRNVFHNIFYANTDSFGGYYYYTPVDTGKPFDYHSYPYYLPYHYHKHRHYHRHCHASH